MKNSLFIFFIIVSLLIGFVAGFYIRNLVDDNAPLAFDGVVKDDTFKAGWEAASERLEESGILVKENGYVEGVVESVDDNKIIFKAKSQNPLVGSDVLKTVIINPETDVILYRERTKAEIEQARKDIEEEYDSLSSEISLLRNRLEECSSDSEFEQAECFEINQELISKEDKQMNLSAQVGDVEIILNPDFNLIKNGFEISVSILVSGDDNVIDIAMEEEFEASKIELFHNLSPVVPIDTLEDGPGAV